MGWDILTETSASDTPRNREIATNIAAYYDGPKEATLAEQWRLRAAAGQAPTRALAAAGHIRATLHGWPPDNQGLPAEEGTHGETR